MNNMKKLMTLLSLMLGVILISSCATKKADSGSAEDVLYNNKWQFVEIDNFAISKEVNGVVPYLSFDKGENRYSAITGCNTVNGTLKVTNSKIEFGLGMSTMMFCENMSVENGFKQILENIKTYKISDNEMILYGNNDKILAKFKKHKK